MAGELKIDSSGKLQLNAAGKFTTDCSSPCSSCAAHTGDPTVSAATACTDVNGTYNNGPFQKYGSGCCFWLWEKDPWMVFLFYVPADAKFYSALSTIDTYPDRVVVFGGTVDPFTCYDGESGLVAEPVKDVTAFVTCSGGVLAGAFTLAGLDFCAGGTCTVTI